MSSIYRSFKREIIFLSTLFISLSIISGYLVYKDFSDSLSREEFGRLKSIRDALSTHVLDYLKDKEATLLSIASNRTTLDAFQEFNRGFQEIEKSEIVVHKSNLQKRVHSFLKRVRDDVPNSNPLREVDEYLPTIYSGRVLQQLYISNNPLYFRKRWMFLSSKENTEYDQAHLKYHLYFHNEEKIHNLYDLFLIDMDGNIIYTSQKEADFGTNIKNGVFSNSKFGDIFRKSLYQNMEQGDVLFSGFSPYEASGNELAGFFLTPIFIDNRRVGTVAIQIDSSGIDSIMDREDGIDSYLVNSNSVMITNSSYISDINSSAVKELWKSSGLLKVSSPHIKDALSGATKERRGLNYIGKDVFSSYGELLFKNARIAILVEKSFYDIKSNIYNSLYQTLTNSLPYFIFLLIFSLVLIIKLIVRPIEKRAEYMKKTLANRNQELRESIKFLDEYKKAVDQSSIVSKANIKGLITYVNQSFCDVSGYSQKELIGKSHSIVRHPEMPKEVFADVWNTISNKRIWKGVIRNRKKDGEDYYVNSTIVPILDDDGEIKEYISIRSDITELMKKEKQILKQSTDTLTKLPNRQKLLDDIGDEVSENQKLGIIQLDRFKEINDFYGMDMANRLLLNISVTLTNILSQNGVTLYIIGDSEFAVLQRSNFENDFVRRVENLVKYFDHNIVVIDDNSFNISVTVGVAYGDRDKIFFNAEMALRRAVETNKDIVSFDKSRDLEDEYQKNIEMTTKIKSAITNGKIVIFGQEIVSNSETTPYKKFEVLIRMVDGEKIISPYFFLDIAKKARLYSTLTKIVIEKSFIYFRDRDDEFSINLNIEDILNSEIVDLLKREIIKNRVGHRLILELVESEGIENFDSVHKFIEELKSLGCRVAIDDFGTGYSNFEYLMKLNVDFIKIDGSLIKNIDKDRDSQLVVQLIVDFAKSKGIKTIGEFVDSESVLQKIKELGIDYSQGFYLSKPSILEES